MRRLLLTMLLLAAAAAPAAAQQPLLDESSCRAQGGPRAACVGLGKLGERVSAECRRLGLADDPTCYSRIGRRVVRAEIDDYERSWLHRTLRFQSALGDGLPLRDATWIGTHNSFNATSEPVTLSHTDSNQQLSLTDQLRLDVRSLELDVHWFPSIRAGGALAPVVCHADGNVGCTTERLLGERLAEVVRWLAAHPDEVLLLYLEDQIDDPAGHEAAARVVGDALGARLYRPRAATPGACTNLPLDLTRDAVRAAGAQVVIVGDCGQGAWRTVSHAWPGSVRFEDRVHGYRPYPACGPPAPAESAAKLVRYYEDSTFIAPALEPLGLSSTDDGLTPATVRALVACGVDMFGFDQLLPADGRLQALAWSWAEGEPRGGRCTVMRADGRWDARRCGEHHPALCRAGDGGWSVIDGELTSQEASSACLQAGAELGTPRTGGQNAAARAALPAGVDAVWLGWSALSPTSSARRRNSASNSAAKRSGSL